MAGKNFTVTVDLNLRVDDVNKKVLREMRKAISDVGKGPIKSLAQQLAPRGKGPLGKRKARLHKSIKWRSFKRSPGGVLRAFLPAWFINNGTVKTPANPFMSNAVTQNVPAIHTAIKDII